MRPQPIAALPRTTRGATPANDDFPNDIAGLVDHVVQRYHGVHLRDLASAILLADEVEQTYAADAHCPHGLGEHLRALAATLEAHQRREELFLFPLLRIGTPRCLDFVARRMAHDHAEVDLQVMALQGINARHRPSFEAPLCWQALSFLCRKLEGDLRAHARLEHEMLYAALLRPTPGA